MRWSGNQASAHVTGRETIVAFTNGFHGVSLGALAATGNSHHRGAAGIGLNGEGGINVASLKWLKNLRKSVSQT